MLDFVRSIRLCLDRGNGINRVLTNKHFKIIEYSCNDVKICLTAKIKNFLDINLYVTNPALSNKLLE